MSDAFYGKEEIKKLSHLKRLNPDLFSAFMNFDVKTFSEGALSSKVKELIAVGCAHVTRCPYCIEAHTRRARAAGASDGEIGEAIFVATAMSAGASLAHSCIAMDVLSGDAEGSK